MGALKMAESTEKRQFKENIGRGLDLGGGLRKKNRKEVQSKKRGGVKIFSRKKNRLGIFR